MSTQSQNELEELRYEVKVLKGKLDEKQAVDIGIKATFTLEAAQIHTAEDFCKAISFWGFHRGNWQNFITPDEVAEWVKVLEQFVQGSSLPDNTEAPTGEKAS